MKINMNKIIRVVEWFSKENSYIVGEEEIKDFDLKLFKKLFNHTYEDDLYIYGCDYRIFPQHVPTIQPLIKHIIDLDKYNYYFGTYEDTD